MQIPHEWIPYSLNIDEVRTSLHSSNPLDYTILFHNNLHSIIQPVILIDKSQFELYSDYHSVNIEI